MDIDAQALTKAQFAGASHLRAGHIVVLQGNFGVKGIQFTVIAKGITHIGEIAFRSVAHAVVPGLDSVRFAC